ncbi:sensor histidine kinase [Oscillospiraceae bacterium HV4-5-C5C]|nr:sensor histidine kinase [Oscillospiraceae bacterium HV4-5-C5C]
MKLKLNKHWSRHFKDSSLIRKIRFIILTVSVLLLSLILLLTFFIYQSAIRSREVARGQRAAYNAASSLDTSVSNIIDRFIAICGSQKFTQLVGQIQQDPAQESSITNSLQTELNDLSNCSYLVSSALIISADLAHSYAPYRVPLRLAAADQFSHAELADTSGVTLLSSRTNPFYTSMAALPLVIPVNLSNGFAEISVGDASPIAYVVLYLDQTKLLTSLDLTSNGSDAYQYDLITTDGHYLTAVDQSAQIDGKLDQEVLNRLKVSQQQAQVGSAQIQGQTAVLYMPLEIGHASLLIHIARQSFMDFLGSARYSLLLAAGILLLIILAISLFMRRYVTDPLKHLVRIVAQIKEGRYHKKQPARSRDEVGQLLDAINSMNDTIQEQMRQIKREEAAKYRTELKLLTEQINPHFLYNTLEEIQSEVVRQDAAAAGNMIQYLAEYLRIGLSSGADLIPITSELRHASAYVNIMNQRFGQSILFMYKIDPELRDQLILKTILQPLIENAIRHGMGIDAPGMQVSVPTIEVDFKRGDNQTILVAVIDNGSGFDASQLEQSLSAALPAEGQHVGLNNVYRRLITFYGQDHIKMRFNSIPYYQNRVSLEIQTGSHNAG